MKNNQPMTLDTLSEMGRLRELSSKACFSLEKLPAGLRRDITLLAIDKWNKDIACLGQMPAKAPCGDHGRIRVVLNKDKPPYAITIIRTPQDRKEHIACVAFGWYAWYDLARLTSPQKTWPENPSQHYLESVGDNASVNTWRVHDPETGFEAFKSDTPDWVIEIASQQKWITRKIGEVSHVP